MSLDESHLQVRSGAKWRSCVTEQYKWIFCLVPLTRSSVPPSLTKGQTGDVLPGQHDTPASSPAPHRNTFDLVCCLTLPDSKVDLTFVKRTLLCLYFSIMVLATFLAHFLCDIVLWQLKVLEEVTVNKDICVANHLSIQRVVFIYAHT